MAHLIDDLRERLNGLPEHELRDVLRYVEALRTRSGLAGARGSAERCLGLAGSMSFEAGELDGLLADIQHAREAELSR